ncbi:LLM class flavin-dependent oxidoreductase [Candidatus Frankia alpina]|uniref:LLM class flavin-dependent oxidoreductase n=1 Tax=Candidatus Frankia alpina TaxID=2699483 RepID=A0A4S5CQ60_9ACTN|nr:LLM class flavin-dependent oxidoreductase [Candidatus Frankia alpina]
MTALSVLDQGPVTAARGPRAVLADAVDPARHVENLGYTRYWAAEHHATPSIGISAPEIVVAHLAAATSTLRIGAGGMLLPNHTPLHLVEQFRTLETLHPGRIDLGIGRSHGTPTPRRSARSPGPGWTATRSSPGYGRPSPSARLRASPNSAATGRSSRRTSRCHPSSCSAPTSSPRTPPPASGSATRSSPPTRTPPSQSRRCEPTGTPTSPPSLAHGRTRSWPSPSSSAPTTTTRRPWPNHGASCSPTTRSAAGSGSPPTATPPSPRPTHSPCRGRADRWLRCPSTPDGSSHRWWEQSPTRPNPNSTTRAYARR